MADSNDLDDLSFWLNELKDVDPAGEEFRNITSLTKELVEKKRLELENENARKARRNELIKAGIMTGVPIISYSCMYIVGLNFEKTGFITSNMVKDLMRRFKS